MFTRQFRFLPLAVYIIILSACATSVAVTGSGTPMEYLYDQVSQGTLAAWGFAHLVVPILWACVVGVVLGAFTNKGVGFIAGIVVAVGIFIFMSGDINNRADAQGIHAMTAGFDQAKTNKANVYIEVLHVPIVAATVQTRSCRSSINSSTGCGPYEWSHEVNPHKCNCTCTSKTKSGTCLSESCNTCWDTEYVPYFNQLDQYAIRVRMMDSLANSETGLTKDPNTKDCPTRILSDHWMVPPDYNSHWYGGSRYQVKASDYTPPADWTLYSNALKNNTIPLANVYHQYTNWTFASDATVYRQTQNNVATYQKAGLLPTMNTIYSRLGQGWPAAYDFVQFVGGLHVPQDQYQAWQDLASTFSTFFGNDRQGSLELVFAPKTAVDSLGTVDLWADTIRAAYSAKGAWDFSLNGQKLQRLMPKNMFIIACEVDGNTIPAAGCRFRTGMPQGNEQVIDDFATGRPTQLLNMTFAPVSFFGDLKAVPAPGKDGFPVVKLQRDGNHPIDLLLRDDPAGVRRISMKGYDYLKADITLDQSEMTALVNAEIKVQSDAALVSIIIPIVALVIVGFGLVAIKSQS